VVVLGFYFVYIYNLLFLMKFISFIFFPTHLFYFYSTSNLYYYSTIKWGGAIRLEEQSDDAMKCYLSSIIDEKLAVYHII
jgi:hypothetical protein